MSDTTYAGKTVREKLAAGAYETKMAWPDSPQEPVVLKKLARHLTDEEADGLAATREAFKAAKKAAEQAQLAYREDVGRLEALFHQDLEAEHGMTGHPKAAALYSKAWENGHSCGLSEVATVYEDLVDLVK